MMSKYKKTVASLQLPRAIARMRKENNISIRALAKRLGVSHSTLRRFEQGRPINSFTYLAIEEKFAKVTKPSRLDMASPVRSGRYQLPLYSPNSTGEQKQFEFRW
jgi:transcriptional regulator with XRE-family HTH domain